MVMSSVSPSPAPEDLPLIQPAVVEPLIRQVLLEQQQFQAPLPAVWKSRTVEDDPINNTENSCSSSTNSTNGPTLDKPQESQCSSSSEEDISAPASKQPEDLETDDCASTSSSSQVRKRLSEGDDEEKEDALDTTDTAAENSLSMMVASPKKEAIAKRNSSAEANHNQQSNIFESNSENSNQAHAALTPQSPTQFQCESLTISEEDLISPRSQRIDDNHKRTRPLPDAATETSSSLVTPQEMGSEEGEEYACISSSERISNNHKKGSFLPGLENATDTTAENSSSMLMAPVSPEEIGNSIASLREDDSNSKQSSHLEDTTISNSDQACRSQMPQLIAQPQQASLTKPENEEGAQASSSTRKDDNYKRMVYPPGQEITMDATVKKSSLLVAPINPEEMGERNSSATLREEENKSNQSSHLEYANSNTNNNQEHRSQNPRLSSHPQCLSSTLSGEENSQASNTTGSDNNHKRISSPPGPEMRLDWRFLRSGILYDRGSEIEALQCACRRQFDGSPAEGQKWRPSLVVVSGLSGTGKSALTKAALEPLMRERNGYYLVGKFDQLRHSEPYAPFVNAMNDYVYYVLQQQQQQNQYEHITSLSYLETLQTEILSALSPEGCSLLLQMIPSLRHILHIDADTCLPHNQHYPQDTHQHATVGGQFSAIPHANTTTSPTSLWESSQDRVKVIFRRFLRVICKPERPCCLVLDDLQWSDTASLDLVESLVCDVENNKGLFLAGICRSNEISSDHNLASLLRRLEDDHHVHIENVIARNLGYKATNQLICDVLKQPWDICLPLTEIIHAQTMGNVFYIINYIKALYADNVLIPDQEFGTGGWLWDEERWQLLYSPRNIKRRKCEDGGNGDQQSEEPPDVPYNDKLLPLMVDLIARQLRRLPEPTQLVMRTCACFGAEIDLALVEKVLIEMDVLAAIQLAVDEGLLLVVARSQDGHRLEKRPPYMAGMAEETQEYVSGHTERRFMFAHDCIQQAAYSLIPESNKSASHLSVGRMLFKNMMSMEEFNDNIFVVVNQMNRGMSHIDDQSERDGLAALNLKAGNRAILSSDFHTAVQYFMVGTTLLSQRPHHWARQYELSLELYNSLAEAEYCVADFDMMDVAVLEVLQNGLDFRDMIRAYATQVYSLGARFMLQEAIDLGLQVLERFDESFDNPSPKRRSSLRALSSPMKTKRKLSWKTKSQLLYMPDMNDPDKLAAMGILNLLTTYSLIGRPSLFPFIAARLVKLSLDHGLCAISAPGFAFFGLWLCSTGDPQAGYRYGTLALDILERYQNTITEWVPRVYSIFYGWIAPWKQPVQSTFPHTLHAHRVGLETGDIEYSCIGAHVYSLNAFFAGMPLPELEASMRKFVDLMNKHKQGPWAAATSVQLQMIHNLMGKSEDPLILRGEIMTDDKVLEIATVQNMESYETYFVQVMVWSLLLAYHFGKLKQAISTANDCRDSVKDLGSSFLVCIQYFYDGMAALAAAADPKFERNKKQHIAVAARALKKLQKMAKHCPENCIHKVYLLQAEFATVRGDLDKAIVLYSKSIAAAHDHGFLQDEALAHERAGLALWRASNNPKANIYLSRALDFYSLWGAEAKVEQLRHQYFR